MFILLLLIDLDSDRPCNLFQFRDRRRAQCQGPLNVKLDGMGDWEEIQLLDSLFHFCSDGLLH